MPLLTVDQIYQTQSRRTASRDVRIGGISIDHVQTVDYGFGIAQVPTATIRVRGHAPAAAVFHATVTIDAGFNGINMRQFTGRIDHVDPDGPDTVLACMGETQALDIPYQKVVYTFTNVSSQQAITDMLNNAGVTAYQVNMPTPLWQIGTVVQPTISFQTWGEAIQKVAEVDGAAWYEFPDGVTRVARVDPIPSVTASRQIFSKNLSGVTSTYPAGITPSITVGGTTYPTLPHIRQPRAEQQIREVKNEVFVRGATLNVTQGDGTVTPLPLEVTGKAPSPWVLKPDGSQNYNDYIFTSELLDTQAKAADVTTRLLSLLNRLTYKATIVVDWDPSVIIGATYQVEDPQYSGMTGNWFVIGYQSSMAETDASTTITLIGGAQAGGQGNISPFAFFVYDIEREVIGTKVYAIVTLNGLLSKDLDGPSVTYSWSDNQGFVTGSTALLTVRIDPTLLTNPWIVTLTVTDNMGATGSLALTISIDATANNVSVPAVFVAFDNYFSATPDGGQTWNDQAAPGGKNVISVGALSRGNALAGTAIFGTQQGDLYITSNYCASALTSVLSGIGSPFVHIGGDRNNIHHVYALTQDGRIYRSIADGAAGSWLLYDDLRIVFGLPAIRANRLALPIGGGIWIYAGEGNGRPLIAIDPVTNGHTWKKVALGGHLLADLTAVGFANKDLYIAEAASREQGELAIILNSAVFQPAVYFTDDVHGDGSHWTRATGLPAKSQGRYIGPDLQQGQFLFAFNDTAVYRGDVANGVIAATVAPAAFQATDAANHGLFMGDWIGGIANTYLLAAEGTPDGTIWKTWDRAGTLQKFRPATGFPNVLGGMNAKQLSIGDPANVTLDSLIAQSSDSYSGTANYARNYARLDAQWSLIGSPASISQPSLGSLQHLGAAYYRIDASVYNPLSFSVPYVGKLQRSTDLITWNDVGPLPNGMQMQQGSYVGDGTASKAITGLGFAPKVVVVKANAATNGHALIRTTPMTNARNVTNSTVDQGIASLDSDGFHVSAIASTVGRTNDAGVTYHWYAFGGPRVVVGSFTGNGASQSVAGVGFQPKMVWAFGATANNAVHWLTPEMVTDGRDLDFGTYAGGNDGLTTLNADGFSVGSNGAVNSNGMTVYYVAFGAMGNLYTGKYTGNGADSRSIGPAPTDSTLVHVKGALGQEARFKNRDTGNLTDAAFQYGAEALVTDRIQRLLVSNAFEIGTDAEVNNNGSTYYYFAVHSLPNPYGVSSIDIGADGTLWLTTMEGTSGSVSVAPELWKSVDGGVTWIKVLTGDPTTVFIHVVMHPTNKDFLVIFGDDNPGIFFVTRSTNATGACTLTGTGPSGAGQSIAHTRPRPLVMQSGRVVVHGGYIAPDWLSIVPGSPGTSGGIYPGPALVGADAAIFLTQGSSNTFNIYRSKDQGQSWQLVSSDFGTGRAFPFATPLWALFYDPVQDRLYVGTNNYGGGGGSDQMVFMIANAAAGPSPAPLSSIFDLTLNLKALFGKQVSVRGLTR